MFKSVIDVIENTIDCSKERDLWRKPLIKTISAVKIESLNLKQFVSSDHLLPSDIVPDAKSIICFFIPFQESIPESNIQGNRPSREWAKAYVETNKLISDINDKLELLMNKNSFSAGKIPATHNFNKQTLMSNWSHRHIAYFAGIGTFGINNMLITKSGCCGRFGSLVTNYHFDIIDPIPLKELCLNKINGSCGLCIKRCIGTAFINNNFNRYNCYDTCLSNSELYKDSGNTHICGKCLVGLPCSTKAPSL